MNTLISLAAIPNLPALFGRAIDPAILRLIGCVLMHFLWQGAAVAAILAIALRILRNRSAALRYRLACVALLAMVIAPLVTCRILTRLMETASVQAPSVALTPRPFQAEAAALRHEGAMIVPGPIIAPSLRDPAIAPARAISAEVARFPWAWVVAGWGMGVVGLSVWRMGGWLHLRRQLGQTTPVANPWPDRVRILADQLGVRRSVRLAQAAWVAVPCVFGFFKPIILLPGAVLTGLTPSQLEAILAHELAHVRRRDYLVNILQTAVETLLFYHPAVWWVSARVREEREFCCDDIAVATGSTPADYAAALAAAEAMRDTERYSIPPHLALAALNGGRESGPLVRRVRRVLGFAPPPRARRVVLRPMAAAFVAAALAAMPWIISARAEKPPANVPAAATTAPTAAAKVDSLAAQAEPPVAEDFVAHQPNYVIGKKDLLNVSIDGLLGPGDQTVKVVRVSETGNVAMPYIPAIKALGLTETELEKEIDAAYKNANLIANANVSVTVVEARGRVFDMLGQIGQPGQYAILKPDFRLTDALAQGKADPARLTNIYIIRKPVIDELAVHTLELQLQEIEKKADAPDPALRLKLAEAQKGKSRIIGVPVAGLKADDQKWKIVIHPGDRVIAEGAPATRPAAGAPLDPPPVANELPAEHGFSLDPHTYVIARGDLLNVKVNDLSGPGTTTNTSVRVNDGGNISMPYIGSIKAIGLTEAGLEKAIADAYKAANLLLRADVSVEVIEAGGRKAVRPGGNPADLLGPPAHSPAATAPAAAAPTAADLARAERTPTQSPEKANSSIENGNEYDPNTYILSKGNPLRVTVSNDKGVGRKIEEVVCIDSDGDISLPEVNLIRAAGLTPLELQNKIAAAYSDKKLIDHPDVTVVVGEGDGQDLVRIAGRVVNGEASFRPKKRTQTTAPLSAQRLPENDGTKALATTTPSATVAEAEPTAADLARADPAMQEMVQNRNKMQSALAALVARLGEHNPTAIAARDALAKREKMIEEYRKHLNDHYILRLKPDGTGGVLVSRNAPFFPGVIQGVSLKASSTMAGAIRETHFKKGQLVKKGDLLVQLIDTEVLAKLDIAKADSDEAATDYARIKQMNERNLAGISDVDMAAAKAKKTKAQLKIAEYQVSQARITAPIDGMIVKSDAIEGQTVQPGDELAVIANNDALVVRANVDEIFIARLKVGQQVNISWGPTEKERDTGTITFISPQIDRASNTLSIEASIPNGNGLLRDGMAVNISPRGE